MDKIYYVSLLDANADEIDNGIYTSFEKAREACITHYTTWYECEDFIKEIKVRGDEDYYTIDVYPDNTIDFEHITYVIYPLTLNPELNAFL